MFPVVVVAVEGEGRWWLTAEGGGVVVVLGVFWTPLKNGVFFFFMIEV